MNRQSKIIRNASLISLAFALAMVGLIVSAGGQVPACLRSATAIVNGSPVTLPAFGDDVPLGSAVSAALGTPGVTTAPSGSLQAVQVTLCSGAVVSCPITPEVLSAVAAVIQLPPPTQPSPPTQPTPPTQPIRRGDPYTVDASETLHVDSTVTDAGGALKCRTWSLFKQVQTGYNAAWWVPETTTPGTYILQEFDAWTTDNEIDHVVTVNPDPYTTVTVLPFGGDLRAAISKAKNLTRIVLLAAGSYTVAGQVFVPQRLQIIAGGPGVTVNFAPPIAPGLPNWPAQYFLWTDAPTAQLTVAGINFAGPWPMRLNNVFKTGLTIAYVPLGTCTFVDCSFRNMDQAVQLDSRPTYQCIGSLFKNVTASDGSMCGCPIWGAGRDMVIEGCDLGPSREEHPFRVSTVNDITNQVPRFVRVGNSRLKAVKQSTLSKESAAIRDVDLFCADNDDFNNMVLVGQGSVNPWDRCQHLVFNKCRISFDTIHLRLGVTGPTLIQNSTFQLPPVNGTRAGTPVTMINVKP